MMQFLNLVASALLALTAEPAAAASIAPPDRAALEQLKDANDAAWNRRDVATISGQYVADATIRVAPNVGLVSGRRAIERFFAEAFARRDGKFRHVTTLAHLDPLDSATVFSEGDVRVEKQDTNGSWSLVRRFRTLSVAVRDDGQWKIRSVRAIPLP